MALRGLRFLGEEPSRGRIRLLGAACTGLAQAGDLAAAEPMMREAFSSAENLGAGTRIQGELLQSKAWLHYAYMPYAECVDAVTRGAELLRKCDEHPAAAILAVTLLGLSSTGRRAEELKPELSDGTIESLSEMAAPENMDVLHALGTVDAARSIQAQSFPAAFDQGKGKSGLPAETRMPRSVSTQNRCCVLFLGHGAPS